MQAPPSLRATPVRNRPAQLAGATLATALAAAALLAGCGGDDDGDLAAAAEQARAARPYAQRCPLPPPAAGTLALPAPRGEHCVGKARFQLAGGEHDEVLTADPTDRRELSLKVWYPVAADRPGPAAEHVDPVLRPLLQALLQSDWPGLALPAVRSWSQAGTAMAAGRRYPVILFSPGGGLLAEQFSALAEDLASHGFVVVAIDHPYISGPTPLSDGRIVFDTTALTSPEGIEAAARQAVADQRRVLDWLQAQHEGTDLLGGHLDLSRIGTAGHSIGGSTALHTARLDGRVRAAVNIDGSVWGDTSGPWTKPSLILLAQRDADPTITAVQRNSTGGPHDLRVIDGTGHLSFSDIPRLLALALPATPAELEALGLGRLDPEAALQITREQLVAFFRRELAER